MKTGMMKAALMRIGAGNPHPSISLASLSTQTPHGKYICNLKSNMAKIYNQC